MHQCCYERASGVISIGVVGRLQSPIVYWIYVKWRGGFPQANRKVSYACLKFFAQRWINSNGAKRIPPELVTASRVGGEIQLEKLPISDELSSAFEIQEQRRFALSGGDDYELCFTAASNMTPCTKELRVTAIGTVTDGEKLICRDADGIVEFNDSGYRHFQ